MKFSVIADVLTHLSNYKRQKLYNLSNVLISIAVASYMVTCQLYFAVNRWT